MKKVILLFLSLIFIIFSNFVIANPTIGVSSSSNSSSSNSSSSSVVSSDDCVKLNTDIPWIWKNKICEKDATSSFGKLMWWLMKLLINFVVAIAFIALIASWVMMMLSWVNQSTAWKWKELLKKVVIWIVLLGLSGLILHTINPNFFK